MTSNDSRISPAGTAGGQNRPDESTRQDFLESRRKWIKTGAILLPAVLTLRATPAWAQTDYTQTAYRYGTNAGLCKNANFNPNAAPDSTAGQQFVPCPTGNPPRKPTRTNPIGSDDTRHFGR